MECPKCGRTVPIGKDCCMYCGFSVKNSPFAEAEETNKTSKNETYTFPLKDAHPHQSTKDIKDILNVESSPNLAYAFLRYGLFPLGPIKGKAS